MVLIFQLVLYVSSLYVVPAVAVAMIPLFYSFFIYWRPLPTKHLSYRDQFPAWRDKKRVVSDEIFFFLILLGQH